jgi:type II secretory pathway pseudopilin PulG
MGLVGGPRRDGFSLIELVMALVIFQVGLLGVVGMLLTAQRILTRAELVLRGATAARAVGDSLLAGGTRGNGYSDLPWGTVSWTQLEDGGLRVVATGSSASDTLGVLRLWPPLPVDRAGQDSVSGGTESP